MSKPRIESHTLNVFAGRKADEGEWDIPLDGVSHHWTVPLVVMEEQGARRVGTAFHVGRLGHLLSARHCVDEALHPAHRGVDLGPEARRVQLLSQLAVIRATDTSREQLRGLAVQTVTGPEPSDLVCLSTIFQTELPQLTLPMSFVLPDVGSTVRCFGFPDPNGPKLFPDYLHAVEGSVKAYFPPGFSRGFMRGPCFLVGASIPHGMSGGPVVNEAGSVCGVVSSGAELFFNEPACLVTPIYAALLIDVALHAEPAPNFRINVRRTLLDLCAEGVFKTDGTEDSVHIREREGELEIGPVLSAVNGAHVYNSFADYLAGVRSTPIGGAHFRIRMDTTDNTSA